LQGIDTFNKGRWFVWWVTISRWVPYIILMIIFDDMSSFDAKFQEKELLISPLNPNNKIFWGYIWGTK
jgi:hypothetical protein